jgi:hypothetical protein
MEPERDRPDEGLRIDPVGVARRSTLPAAVAVIVAIAFVGLALAKPWDSGRALSSVAPSGNAPPAASDNLGAAQPTPFAIPPTPADMAAAASNRHDWGVRAIVVPATREPRGDGTDSGLAERWLPVDVDSGAAWDSSVTGVAVEPGDEVVALGLTTPDDEMPLDVRFWRFEPGVTTRRIVPRPLAGPEAGSWLFLPDLRETTVLGTWPAGTYRIDVLLGQRIVRLVTVVPPGVAAGVPRATAQPVLPANLVDQVGAFNAGPFAVAPGGAFPLLGDAGDPLDERAAWLGPATGQLEIAAVSQIATDPVSAIGLLLDPGEQLTDAVLDRVRPTGEGPGLRVVPLPPVPMQGGGDRTSAVIIEHTDLRAVETGFYHLTATATFPDASPNTRTWNLEIVPATPPPPPGRPLVRMTRWVPLMADIDQLADEPLVSERDLGLADGDGTCGGSAHIGPDDGLFGIVEPRGFVTGRVRMVPLGDTASSDVAIRVAPNVVDGLTIVAVPSGGLAAGEYRLSVASTSAAAPENFTYTVCVS